MIGLKILVRYTAVATGYVNEGIFSLITLDGFESSAVKRIIRSEV